jgi:hypothetical protein
VRVQQPPYMFGTTQVEVFLKVNTVYYIVPSLFKRKQAGAPHTVFLLLYTVNCMSYTEYRIVCTIDRILYTAYRLLFKI